MLRFDTPLLDQVLQDARSRQCVELLDPVEVMVDQFSSIHAGDAPILLVNTVRVLALHAVVVARLERVILNLAVYHGVCPRWDDWERRVLRGLRRRHQRLVKLMPLGLVDIEFAHRRAKQGVVREPMHLIRAIGREGLPLVRLPIQKSLPFVVARS